MADYTVDRRTWLRGETGGTLCRADGCMCAVGMMAVQDGLDPSRILGRGLLAWRCREGELPNLLTVIHGDIAHRDWVQAVMHENDKLDITDAEREVAMARIVTKAGHTLAFTN